MRVLKNIWSQLHTFVLWGLASALIWAYVFTFVTDTSPEKKVMIYCDVPEIQDIQLAARLEEDLPEGIRMIKVRSFQYVMMDTDNIQTGDLFLLPASKVEEYRQFFQEGDAGTQVYDAETHAGIAEQYIKFGDENYYLFCGAKSPHLDDGKAREVANILLNIP